MKKRGISLIVLVITILVMIILAGVVVVTMQNNNPIEKAKEATGKTNLISLIEEVEMYKANAVAQTGISSVNLTFAEAQATLKSVPDGLKGSVLVSNGSLGIRFSKLDKNLHSFAIENNIFDADDLKAPEVAIYTREENGKKYLVADAIDYETDVAKIYNEQTGKTINPNLDYEKILLVMDRSKDKVFSGMFKQDFRNIEICPEEDISNVDISKYNVIVGYGAQFLSITAENQKLYKDKFSTAGKENPGYIVTGGNDTMFDPSDKHIFEKARAYKGKVEINFTYPVQDNIAVKLDETKTQPSFYTDDSRALIKFRESPYMSRYVTNSIDPAYPDCTGLYLDRENKKGWFHIHEAGDWDIPEEIQTVADIYKAAITKMTGSRTMEIDITNVAPGTKYTFEIVDLGGNKITKEFTI